MVKAITDEVSKLTAKQMRIVEAFLADPSSATAAAITAGYGQKSAHVSASRLIRLPKVLQALMQGVRGVLQRAAIKAAIKLEKLIDHKSVTWRLRHRRMRSTATASGSMMVVLVSDPV